MASYAMVFSGAPLFFWRWAILCAVFLANILATYYSREKIWSTPYTLLFGGPFPEKNTLDQILELKKMSFINEK